MKIEGLSLRMQNTSLVSPNLSNFKEYYSPVLDGGTGGNFNNEFLNISKMSKQMKMFTGSYTYKHSRNTSTIISEKSYFSPR